MAQKPIMIKKSQEGSLRRIAQRAGAIKKNGEINRTWMRQKLNNSRTSEPVKKKLRFALNIAKPK